MGGTDVGPDDDVCRLHQVGDRAPPTPMHRRLAYLGTPEAAVPPLRALVEAGHDIALVITRPDRRRGRGPVLSPSPVKSEAQRLHIPVAHDIHAVLEAGVTLGVVVAFGRIIPVDVLRRVPMVNVHFSLLPSWRGAAPVERAILAGDAVTGVSIMAVEEGLDTGPLYASEQIAIGDAEDVESLRSRLALAGARLVVDVLGRPLSEPAPQAGSATYAAKITQDDLLLRWDKPAAELARVVRLGRAWTTWRGNRLRVLEARAEAEVEAAPAEVEAAPAEAEAAPAEPETAPDPGSEAAPPPGTIIEDAVVTGRGRLRVLRVQAEGREPLTFAEWRRGARPQPGARLGTP